MGLPIDKLPEWPAAMDRETALAYTGVGASTMRSYENVGVVRFRALGPHGSLIAPREHLDKMLSIIWSSGPAAPIEDMQIG